MSRLDLELTATVWHAQMPKGISKLVLLAFCAHVNEAGLCWPSIGRLARLCGMGERTIQTHVRALKQAGILCPRHIRTGHATRYAVNLDSLKSAFADDSAPVDSSAPELPGAALNPADFAQTPAESGIRPPQLSTQTPADSAPITVLNLKENIERTETPAPALPALMMVDGVNPQVLADFAAIRAKKRVGPLNATALEALCGEAAIAGMSLEQVLKTCCTRNWARFEAAWMADAGPRSTIPSHAAITVPAPPAGQPPEPVKLAAPEVVAAGRERLAAIRQTPAPVPVGIQIGGATGTGWACALVNKAKTGQRVAHAALRDACKVLKLDPASLTATVAPAAAARMH